MAAAMHKTTIVKKNKVWSSINVEGVKYPLKMKSASLPEEVKSGDTVYLLGEVVYTSTKYGTSCEFVVRTEDEAKQAVVDKWLPLFDKSADNGHGYYYKRAVEEIHNAGIHDYDKHFADTKYLIDTTHWWREFLTAAKRDGYVYERAIKELHYAGCHDHDAEIEAWKQWIAAKKIAEREAKEAARRQQETDDHICHLRIPAYCGFAGRPEKGSVLMHRGIPYKVLSSYYHDCDGFSFGAGAEEWYEVKAQDISDTEKGLEMLANLEVEKQAHELARKKDELLRSIRSAIIANGKINEQEINIGDIPGTVVSNTMNVYGGGDLLTVDESSNTVWLVINNGADGDNWGINTIVTGGAGAYGYTAEYETVRQLIDNYRALG